MAVAAILRHKGHDVLSVAPTVVISEVTKMLSARRIGAVVVQDVLGQLLGILTERDVMYALAAHGAAALDMTAAQLMTRTVWTADMGMSVAEAMEVMTRGRFRHLPVVEGGTLRGIISIGDVVKWRIDEQANEVDSLKAYVAGAA